MIFVIMFYVYGTSLMTMVVNIVQLNGAKADEQPTSTNIERRDN